MRYNLRKSPDSGHWRPLPFMGVQTMTEQSENKGNEITATDKSTPIHSEQNKTKLPKGELSEQELEKVSGGVKSWGITVGSL
jgi:hypothetical protein